MNTNANLDQDKTKQPEIEYVVVEEDPNKPEDKTSLEDERISNQEDEAAASEGATDEERDAIRERRRKERVERKTRREEAINRDKLELDFLRKRNDDLERRFTVIEHRTTQQDVASFDAAITNTRREINLADQVIAKAVTAGNGDDVVKATRIRDQAVERLRALADKKNQFADQVQQSQNPGIDETTLAHAKSFINDNSWYNPRGGDEDSDIVISIDRALARKGLDPRSEEYWEELREKVRKRLPEKFESEKPTNRETRESRGGPQVGSGRGDASHTSGRQEVYISADRKQAMMDAGVWDDPVLRQRYIKRYAEYDKSKSN